MTRILAVSVFLILLVAGPVWSHHSAASLFNMTERFNLTGTLTGIEWTNPHILVFVEVMDDGGLIKTWSFEGPPPRGFREGGPAPGDKSDFEDAIGQTVTVETSPAWDGSPSGLLRHITLPDRTVLRLCNDAAC